MAGNVCSSTGNAGRECEITRIDGMRIKEDCKIGGYGCRFIKARKPFADQSPAQSKKYRYRYGVRPSVIEYILEDVAHQSSIRIVQLTPSDHHRAHERHSKRSEEDIGRTGKGFREISSATKAAQKGEKLKIAADTIG